MEERVARLYNEDILRQAAARFGLRPEQAHKLDGFENFIYLAPRNGNEVVLRISHSSKKTRDDIQAEVNWLHYLADHGAAVARPLPSRQGRLVEAVPAAEGSYFSAATFEKAPGAHPRDKDYGPALYRTWGRALGKLHRLARGYRPPEGAPRRPEWDQEVEVTQPEVYLPAGHEKFLAAYARLLEQVRALPVEADSYGLIHNDSHPHNILWDDGRLTLIDFEDCVRMWYVSDLAISLFMITVWPPEGWERQDFARAFWRDFLRGYREESDLAARWLAQAPLFLKVREFGQYVAMYRGFNGDMQSLDPWARRYMDGRLERLEQDVPYLDIDFMAG